MAPIRTVLVHKKCRRDFTDQKRKAETNVEETEVPNAKRLRSSFSPFNWNAHCMLCGKSATIDTRHPNRTHVKTVTTLPLRSKILEQCHKRGDLWASEVQTRLHGCIDLVAAEVVYHSKCFSRFMLNKESHQVSAGSDNKAQGRPEDHNMLQWFDMLCQWLESEAGAETYSLTELQNKMKEFSGNSEVYTVKRLKQKLQEHYKEFIFFAEVEGRGNVVCFKNMAKYIINEKWYSEKKADIEDEAERIVITAAKIIRAEIRDKEYNLKSYPTNDDISSIEKSSEWIPRHLQTLMKTIVSSELKQNSIGQCIVQAARPRSVITPTLFGLGVELDHVFGSKWLVNELSRLGFSIAYDEVNRYKQSVIQSENLENLLTEYPTGTFTQWVADNIDHNVATLDGEGTFHGMGIIAVSTSEDMTPLVNKSRVISRQQRLKVNELVKHKGVTITQYLSSPEKGLASLVYKPIIDLQSPFILPLELCSDLLWHSGWIFSKARPRPNWSGFMQHIFCDNQNCTPRSEVLFLPIIDLNPTDETCIYSTLIYIESQAQKLNIPTPCITFDQPLWLKAVEIIRTKSMNIVCRLGGFHTMMSFLGSIGSMMKGSGLEEALENAYGPNAVTHMMSGKAISRALRGHFLIEAALINKLMLRVLPHMDSDNVIVDPNREAQETMTDSSQEEGVSDDMYSNDMEILINTLSETDCMNEMPPDETGNDLNLENRLAVTEVEKLHSLYEGVVDKIIPTSTIAESQELLKLENCLLNVKSLLAEKSPTAQLWLQYIEYIETLKLFIRAERTGNWNLHLISVSRMINLFAATGHINYAKSSRLYLQLMNELPTDHPWLYHCFIEQGFHTVRRSSRYWAGLWTDLTIEQVMMRSIKSRGGLTRGRGMTESVRLQWICSMHKCAGIHNAMTTITNSEHQTSEQHVDLGVSRSNRDFRDLNKIQGWFDHHEPFNLNEHKLRSLSSGLTATEGDGINCHKTEEIGRKLQKHLDNISVLEASIKRSEQIKSLDHLYPGIKVDKEKVHINPTLLFSRLIALVQREEDMLPYFDYELTAIPTSLFKDYAMRKTAKAQLAKVLMSKVQPSGRNAQLYHVLDGGALIHRVKWLKRETYSDIAKKYVSYVHHNYGHSCIVFDGYNHGPSIKDHEHQRRLKKTCADIQLGEFMEAHHSQQIFLSNESNKSQFISLLSQHLEADGNIVHVADGDADTMIVSCALQYAAQGREVNVVADDTDVLVLLMYHWEQNMANIHFLSEVKRI